MKEAAEFKSLAGSKHFKLSGFFFVFFLFFYCFFIRNSFSAKSSTPFTAAIVVNAVNGEVLYSYNENKIIYPASLTKIMTSYIVFEALKNGTIGLNDVVRYGNNDKHSATINDLIMKMVVSSLNYPAEILANEISGDEKSFILQMNAKAKEIGMKNTHFVNPHGLFNEKHRSTARDIVMLAIRLVYDFPKFSEYFGITNYIDENGNFKKKTSDIQQNIRGIDGSKTGYIDASGYNLAVWGRYGKKHIFAVVIGADNKINRDALIIKLINQSIGEDLEKSIVDSKRLFNERELNDFFRFLNIDLKRYSVPIPTERYADDGVKTPKRRNTGYFYKN